MTIITNGGYSDWVAAMQVVSQELAKVGIKLTVDGVAATNFYTDVYEGKFQLAYNAEAGGPAPFYEMRQWLFSKNSAPIGTAASSNWERYYSPAVDALLEPVPATTSAATQQSIINKLQTGHGQPGAGDPGPRGGRLVPVQLEGSTPASRRRPNPYAQPGLYNIPDWGVVLLHLKPISSSERRTEPGR